MTPAVEQEEGKLQPAFERVEAGVRLRASTSLDRLKLFLEVRCDTPEALEGISRELLLRLLDSVPREFLHLDVLDSIIETLKRGEESKPRRVAKGIPPRDGRNGRLLLLVKPYDPPSRERPREFIDPRFFKSFDNIEIGNPVVRLYPPQPGTPGRDCFGEPIPPAPGKPVSWKHDETLTELPPTSQNGYHTLVAARAGFLTKERDTFKIKSELVVPEVSFRTGDIEFIGSVKVEGPVQKGFRIKAREDIVVLGDVDQGQLETERGSIRVQGAIIGVGLEPLLAGTALTSGMLQEARRSSGNQLFSRAGISATLIDGATVEAYGDVEAVREIRASHIRTRGILRVTEGQLVSGEVFSCCGVEAKRLGNKLGGQLIITATSDVESSHEFQQLLQRLRHHEEVEQALRLQLGPYATNRDRLQLLPPALRSKIELLQAKLRAVTTGKAALEAEKASLLSGAKVNPSFRVNYHEVAYAGVVIKAGECLYRIESDMRGPGTIEYFPNEQRFDVSALKPIECFVNPDGTPRLPERKNETASRGPIS